MQTKPCSGSCWIDLVNLANCSFHFSPISSESESEAEAGLSFVIVPKDANLYHNLSFYLSISYPLVVLLWHVYLSRIGEVRNWYGKKWFPLSCLLTTWNQHRNENYKLIRLFLVEHKWESDQWPSLVDLIHDFEGMWLQICLFIPYVLVNMGKSGIRIIPFLPKLLYP